MYKVLLACLFTLFGAGAEAQRDYPSQRDYSTQREARSQRNYDICVHKQTRGQRVSRRTMRNIQRECTRRVTSQEQRRVQRLRPNQARERY
jgi:hypothetical protein